MPPRTYLRWDIHQRLQHFLLLVSVILLVLTGMPLRYPEAVLSRRMMGILGGAEIAGRIHRGAAVLLVLGTAYHLLYLVGVWRRQGWSSAMWPRRRDGGDLFQMLGYFLGLCPHPPRFDRYSYVEKFEYWAMVWGTLIMVATGLMLWFPIGTARVFPVLFLHLAQVIHSYEALLAALSLIIWHFYHAHLNPEVFPMSMVWLTGRITAEELQHHHPLEYERLQAPEQRIDDEDSLAPVRAVGGVADEPLLHPATGDLGEPVVPAESAPDAVSPRTDREEFSCSDEGAASPEREPSSGRPGTGPD